MVYHERIRETLQITPETGPSEGYHPHLAVSSDCSHSGRIGFRERKPRPKMEAKGFGRLMDAALLAPPHFNIPSCLCRFDLDVIEKLLD